MLLYSSAERVVGLRQVRPARQVTSAHTQPLRQQRCRARLSLLWTRYLEIHEADNSVLLLGTLFQILDYYVSAWNGGAGWVQSAETVWRPRDIPVIAVVDNSLIWSALR